MTSIKDNKENERIDEAWQKLTSKLQKEEMSPKWTAWASSQLDMKKSEEIGTDQVATSTIKGEMREMKVNEEEQNVVNKNQHSKPKRKKSRRHPAKKWISIAAAAAIAGVMVATPIGDKALAAILNQFRMEEVTSVDEGELMNFISTISEGEGVHEFISKYGTFTNKSDDDWSLRSKTAEQIAEQLGIQAVTDDLINPKHAGIIESSQTITMKLDIPKVNATMKRLGADDLMPESLDGKLITFEIPATLYQIYQTADEEKTASIYQQKIPRVSIDSSASIEDAVKAVLNFPLLPDRMKSAIQTEQILGGKLPLPIITDGKAEKINVDGTFVILEDNSYNYYGESGEIKETTNYVATWTKDDVLYRLEGYTLFDTKEKLIQEIKELMNQ
ncbi:hypothetical protein [Paenibacillus sp. An7]|uniref:hypothetical protein n=1 Tax=Paenibacillus sp. An7 TaxID=2689577 RepID=UPI00135A35A3|nr:hypothetical protein [Paenibacillus sp. An7]